LISEFPDPQARGHEIQGASHGWHGAICSVLAPFSSQQHTKKEEDSDPATNILCGFNFVDDNLFSIATETQLAQLVAAWGNPTPGIVSREPSTIADVLACLLEAARNPSAENKFYIRDPQLLDFLMTRANKVNLSPIKRLGGAAGNISYVLTHLNCEVDIAAPYHSHGLQWSELKASHARFLDFNSTPPRQPVVTTTPNLPNKLAAGFQLIPAWTSNHYNLNVNQPSRSLFIGSDASSSLTKGWNIVRLKYNGQRDVYPPPRWLDPRIWPYPSLFTKNISSQGNVLEIDAAEPSLLSQLADQRTYTVAIIKETGYAQQPDLLMKARKDQLAALQDAGVPIHVELSAASNLGLLKDSLLFGPWSVSLNQDDLLKLTATRRSLTKDSYDSQSVDPFLFPKGTLREGMFQRFLRAKSLLQDLGADWIYVHGNELDMTVYKGESAKSLGKKLRDSMLLAKAVVVAAMILRDTPPHLRPLVNNYLQGATLAPKAFWALFEFATEFARWVSVRYSTPPEKQVRNAFLSPKSVSCGWFQNDDFGVTVAPVFWPDVAKFLNATGAGDYSCAVVATHAWK
jgi:hypothetical protein